MSSKLKKQYLVVACTRCGRLLLAVSDKKTRTCPYCGHRVKLGEARVVTRSENPKKARLVLQETKTHDLNPNTTAALER
jgi:DNA-directed RNA polymerase subunit RPC12/RpoP